MLYNIYKESDIMQIKKYKYLSPNKYKIFLEEDSFILYEDIIIKYNILSKQNIEKEEIDKFLKDNEFYEWYYKILSFIKFKLRSKKEIETYLLKNKQKKETINLIITRLEKEGYINDKFFTKSYINDQINLKNNGPLKIIKDLEQLGIEENIIKEEITIFTKEQQINKIKKLVDKQVRLNKNKSLYMLKNKILSNLITLGYYKEDIISELDNINIDEESIYEKEYNKIYNKLSKKYSGYDLEQKIKQKLYQKGLFK